MNDETIVHFINRVSALIIIAGMIIGPIRMLQSDQREFYNYTARFPFQTATSYPISLAVLLWEALLAFSSRSPSQLRS